MRVIAGSAKGLKLFSPKGLDTRPTADRMKETLFNMLAFDVPGCRFLDLFSGTGAIGIEALSRGAQCACLVDKSKEAVQAIRRNLSAARLSERAVVMEADVLRALSFLHGQNKQFDLVYMDPPYALENAVYSALQALAANSVCAEDGQVIIEQASGKQVPEGFGFVPHKQKRTKTTQIIFLKREQNDAGL